MAKLKIKLKRNLRREIMRGHPWVYKEAIEAPASAPKAQLCEIADPKGELAWGIYDPHGPLSLRILSTEKNPPTPTFFQKRFHQALDLRKAIRSENTNAYRLFNGEGDFLPGLVCDLYDTSAIVQFDGQGPGEFWDRVLITQWLLNHTAAKTVYKKFRRGDNKPLELLGGEKSPTEILIKENGVTFKVDLAEGQKTGFFLDQRDNRNYIKSVSAGKSVLNLFSYSGGFSVYAGAGGAKKVASVDISKGAIALAEENWVLNKLSGHGHFGFAADVFDFLKNQKDLWDHIIVDPPSMSHSESQKTLAKSKYIELFAAAAKKVVPHGEISFSSCSSHISFGDFSEIITECLSQSRRRGQVLRISGQGPDHPFPHACHELRYLKFAHLILD